MRVSTESREVLADPGTSPEIVVTVVNTGSIIDGVSARVIGAGAAPVRSEPAMLPLFPDAEGRIAVALDLPETQPAGRHPLTVEVVSHTTGAIEHADVELEVGAHPSLSLQRHPRMIRARRSGRFVLEVQNRGNVPLEVALTASATDEGVAIRLNPDTLRVEPGTTASVMAVVKGPRMITGAELDRVATIDVAARRAGALVPAEDERAEAEPEPELTDTTTLQLRQRPTVSRGLLTFLVLACIVGLWAGVFLLGLGQVFKGDATTKTAPPSFFANLKKVSVDDAAEAAATTGSDDEVDAQPAGTLPKDGLMPPGSGAEVNGTVTALSDGAPVGRILVEAFRTDAEGRRVQVSSGATQADGSYSLAGLFPRTYQLKFSATGFKTAWYAASGAVVSPANADEVVVDAPSTTDGIDAVVEGELGSIRGTVDPGDLENAGSIRTRVEARQLGAVGVDAPVARAETDASGAYRLTGLTAPGTYQLSFTTPGYRVTTVTQRLDGGENRIQPAVLLSADGGVISGHVRSDGDPLGGVTVSTVVDGETVTQVTPTSGDTGAFMFQNLPTPGTYIITVTGEGYGTSTGFVRLAAGESATGEDIVLAQGTGTITGRVNGEDGGLGGVTVTVGGAPTDADGLPPTTTTFTSGADIGRFALNGLPVPGNYTLTFSKAGYADETIPVALTDEAPGGSVRFTMSGQLGDVHGAITDPDGGALVGATITASNGHTSVSTTSSSPSATLPGGGYLFRGLAPGYYSVTVAFGDYVSTTRYVQVVAGKDLDRPLQLRRGRG